LRGDQVVLEEPVSAFAQEGQERRRAGKGLAEPAVVDEKDNAARGRGLRRLDDAAPGCEPLCFLDRGDRSRRSLQVPAHTGKVVLDDSCATPLSCGDQELEGTLRVGESTQVTEVAAGKAACPQRSSGYDKGQLLGECERAIGRLDGRRIAAGHELVAGDPGDSVDQLGPRD